MYYSIVVEKNSSTVFFTRISLEYLNEVLNTGFLPSTFYLSIDEILYKTHGLHICDCDNCYICQIDDELKEKKFYCENLKDDELCFKGII